MTRSGPDALVLDPRPDAAGRARQHVRAALLGWGLDDLVDPVLLLTSEVVTNALLHSGTVITVVVEPEGPGVRVSVEDGSTVPPVRRRQSTTASTGRGVQLLEAVSDRWGHQLSAVGKVVWFTVLSAEGWAPALDLEDLSEAER